MGNFCVNCLIERPRKDVNSEFSEELILFKRFVKVPSGGVQTWKLPRYSGSCDVSIAPFRHYGNFSYRKMLYARFSEIFSSLGERIFGPGVKWTNNTERQIVNSTSCISY